MTNALPTVTAIVATLLAGTLTLSAQEVRETEKKVVIVTVEENGPVKDSIVIEGDTVRFEDGNLIIETGEGKRIIRKPGKGSRMVWNATSAGLPGRIEDWGAGPGRAMTLMPEEKEGVFYNISVDGVVVNIRAPKEKAGEADKILSEVKKILMKK